MAKVKRSYKVVIGTIKLDGGEVSCKDKDPIVSIDSEQGDRLVTVGILEVVEDSVETEKK